MDSLKTLLKKQQYNLIIDVTKDQHDLEALIYRLNAFVVLNKTSDVLLMLNDYIDGRTLFLHDPFKIMDIHFGILFKEKKFTDALKALKQYKDYDYVSQAVEDYFKNTQNKIDELIKLEERAAKLNNPDEMINVLENETKTEILMSIIYKLRDYEINQFLDSLISLINKKGIDDQVKTLILILLKSKKVDREIKFVKRNKEYKLNLIKLATPFTDEYFKEVLELVKKLSKDPSVESLAVDLLNQLAMSLYPEYINIANKEELADALILLTNKYLNNIKSINNPLCDKIEQLIK